MKRFVLVFIVSMFIFTCSALTISAYFDEIKVCVDGEQLVLDTAPMIENGRTLVPFRGVMEALGATVSYDDTAQEATAEYKDTIVRLTVDSPIATIERSGKVQKVELQVAATLSQDRLMVPVRFVSEQLGFVVGWDNFTQTVVIIDTDTLFDLFSSTAPITYKYLTRNFSMLNDTYATTLKGQCVLDIPDMGGKINADISGNGRTAFGNEYLDLVCNYDKTSEDEEPYTTSLRGGRIKFLRVENDSYMKTNLFSLDPSAFYATSPQNKWILLTENSAVPTAPVLTDMKETFRSMLKSSSLTKYTYGQIVSTIQSIGMVEEKCITSVVQNGNEIIRFVIDDQILASLVPHEEDMLAPYTFSFSYVDTKEANGNLTSELSGSLEMTSLSEEFEETSESEGAKIQIKLNSTASPTKDKEPITAPNEEDVISLSDLYDFGYDDDIDFPQEDENLPDYEKTDDFNLQDTYELRLKCYPFT